MKSWHWIGLIVLGFAIGYWMPALGNATLGKLYTPRG